MRLTPMLSLLFVLGCSDETQVARDASVVVTSDAGADASNEDTGSDPEVPIEEIEIAANGFVFDARAAGPLAGEPVILLHGFPQTSRAFLSQLAVLGAAGYRAVAPDQRGYSKGARPEGLAAYAITNLFQDVVAMADALGFARFHVVGHDWGASVAWLTSVFAQDRVRSLTALSIPHADAFFRAVDDPSSCQAQASQYIATFSAQGAEAMFLDADAAFLRSLYEGIPAHAVEKSVAFFRDGAALTGGLNWYRANLSPGSARSMLGPVHVPTLYVWSDGDISLCRETAETTGEYVKGPYRFEVLAGVNHWLPELGGQRLNDLLLAHLRAYPGADAN
jgi:pimeloyl-ACP methyl ester carboxylesterase